MKKRNPKRNRQKAKQLVYEGGNLSLERVLVCTTVSRFVGSVFLAVKNCILAIFAMKIPKTAARLGYGRRESCAGHVPLSKQWRTRRAQNVASRLVLVAQTFGRAAKATVIFRPYQTMTRENFEEKIKRGARRANVLGRKKKVRKIELGSTFIPDRREFEHYVSPPSDTFC